LDHPTQVLGAPIVRDADGLALSSRNVYLSADERRQALVLSQGLARLGQAAREGRDLRVLEAEFAQAIEHAGGRVDYAAAVDADTLEPLQALDRPGRALVAAWFGGTRLLDNAAL
jgi:pantoate--beta-alanine ligase